MTSTTLPAGFGDDFVARRPPVGGAHTKMRMDSMEKFFGSQGLASPLEPPGRLHPAVLVAIYGKLCNVTSSNVGIPHIVILSCCAAVSSARQQIVLIAVLSAQLSCCC